MQNRNLLITLVVLIFGSFIAIAVTQEIFVTEQEEFIYIPVEVEDSLDTSEENISPVNEVEAIPTVPEKKRTTVEILENSGRESLCPSEGFRKIWQGDTQFVGSYSCQYREGELITKTPDCKENFKDEFIRRRYNIVNECLYDNGKLLSETPLSHELFDGGFGPKNIDGELSGIFNMEITFEWHRFIHENKLFILLAGNAGCGGCWASGPYLIIDLASGEIKKEFYDFPYYLNHSLSPEGDKIIFMNTLGKGRLDFDVDNQRLHILDIPTLIVKEIYTVPNNQSLIDGEYWNYLIKDAVIWDSNDEVRVAQIKKNQSIEDYERGYAAFKNRESENFFKRYTFLGEPVKVPLNED
jgi:hypothetical protein